MDLYAHIFENIPDALIVVGPDGRIRMANARVLPMLGYRPEELVGQAIEILVPGEHAPTHAAYRERYMASPHTRRMGATQMRLRARRKDGSEFPADIMLSPLNEGGAPVILCAVRDITERGALEEQLMRRTKELETLHVQLTELASRDPLTSLHNRRSFGEQLEWLLRNACRRRESLSLLMIDLDRFKRVNDRFGHAEGDRTLRAVSEAIAGACRQNDVAARYGGEEFAVALPDTDAAGSLLVAENVRHAIEDIAGLRERITASIGAATWVCGEDAAVPPQTADELIAQADRALYRAKAEGRNCVRHGGAQAAAGHLSV